MSDYRALASRIRSALEDVNNSVERAIKIGQKATRSRDDDYWDGVALNLHGFYTGIEHIFEDIARTFEGDLLSGPDWHMDLLMQMSGEVAGLRPAVIHSATRRCLDEYRGFRHVVRNVYTFQLRPSRLQELVTDLTTCFEKVKKDLLAFAEFLEQVDKAE